MDDSSTYYLTARPEREPHMTAPTAPAPQPNSKKAADPGTSYVILGVYENDWTIAGTVKARTSDDAIKQILSEPPDELPTRIRNTNTYVAVPARSWKPVTVTRQTVTTLKLEEAK